MKKIKIKNLVSSIIYHIILLTFSYFIGKLIQMILFLISFNLIQNCFKYRFHSEYLIKDSIKAVKICKLITILIEILYLIMCKELYLSFYLNLIIIIIISILNCLIGYLVLENNKNKNIFKDKELLLKACKRANLTILATNRLIAKYIDNKTYQEIAFEEKLDCDTIKKSISRSKKKIEKCPPFVL